MGCFQSKSIQPIVEDEIDVLQKRRIALILLLHYTIQKIKKLEKDKL